MRFLMLNFEVIIYDQCLGLKLEIQLLCSVNKYQGNER